MKKLRYLLVVGIILFDQIVKVCIRSTMYIGESIPVVGNALRITYVQNRGAAFSIFSGQGFVLIIVPVAAIVFALWYMGRHRGEHWTLSLSLCMMIAGGIGNLIDRVLFGFVTDMFDLGFWPVFNIADISVCVGAGILVVYTLVFSGKESPKKGKA